MAWRARSSATATTASRPDRSNGQATSDGVPQLSPAMIESWGPGTVTIRPTCSDRSTQAAASGSTPSRRDGRRSPRRCQCRTAAAASPPTPTGMTTTSGAPSPRAASWASTSQKMVA